LNRNRPNVVVLVLDSLRASQASCYGYERRTTPSLDAFARRSVLFRRAFSPATWTVPSHASMLTGLYVSQHRIESIEVDRRFNEAIVTLPELLRRDGYRTAAFSHNPLFSPAHGLGEGFEEFHEMDDLAVGRLRARLLGRVIDRSGGAVRALAQYGRRTIAPRLVLDAAERWITERQAERAPYFLFANLLAPHFPWAVPFRTLLRAGALRPRYLLRRDFLTLKDNWAFNAGLTPVTQAHREGWRRLYDAAVMQADKEVGRFLRRLSRRRGWDNTIVVITSDHGEMLGEHRDIVGHILTLHDNLTHVPLIVRHPGYLRGLEVEAVVQTHDLYSTLAEWTGAPVDDVPPAQLQRPSLSVAVEQPADAGRLAFAEEDYSDAYDVLGKLRQLNPELAADRYPVVQRMVRSATHKYVSYNGSPGERAGELYSLVDDPGEEENLLPAEGRARTRVLSKLEKALSTWHGGLEVFAPREAEGGEGMDEVTEERLRALGYIP
jgi:arylsulfatase A-like enzyme